MSSGYTYSPSTGGFHHVAVHHPHPRDAIAISVDEYAQLLIGQAAGMRIETGPNGRPVLIDPATDPAPRKVPTEVSRLQARLTCLELSAPEQDGQPHLWAWLEAWAAQSADDAARAYFEDAPTWRRSDPHVAALAQSIGLSADDVDELFILAAGK